MSADRLQALKFRACFGKATPWLSQIGILQDAHVRSTVNVSVGLSSVTYLEGVHPDVSDDSMHHMMIPMGAKMRGTYRKLHARKL